MVWWKFRNKRGEILTTDFGKTIRLFLIEGNPNGRWVCELSNWTGKAYKIAKTQIKSSTDRNDLTSAGVYFLFGRDDESDKESVYIGEAETVIDRLIQQLGSDWTECVVFISKDKNLNKAHVKYLERRFYNIAKEANRYKITNSTTPAETAISEADTAEMEEYIQNAKLMLNAMGHKVLEPVIAHGSGDKSEKFYIKGARGADGTGKPTFDGFVVLKGSSICREVTPTMMKSIAALREICIADGRINSDFKLQEDMIFKSPSSAAVFVVGRSSNGRDEWKTKTGVSLNDYENKE